MGVCSLSDLGVKDLVGGQLFPVSVSPPPSSEVGTKPSVHTQGAPSLPPSPLCVGKTFGEGERQRKGGKTPSPVCVCSRATLPGGGCRFSYGGGGGGEG